MDDQTQASSLQPQCLQSDPSMLRPWPVPGSCLLRTRWAPAYGREAEEYQTGGTLLGVKKEPDLKTSINKKTAIS